MFKKDSFFYDTIFYYTTFCMVFAVTDFPFTHPSPRRRGRLGSFFVAAGALRLGSDLGDFFVAPRKPVERGSDHPRTDGSTMGTHASFIFRGYNPYFGGV